jgi:hypothetical protein
VEALWSIADYELGSAFRESQNFRESQKRLSTGPPFPQGLKPTFILLILRHDCVKSRPFQIIDFSRGF